MTGLTRKAATCQRPAAVLKMLPLLVAVLTGYACNLAAAQANSTAEAASQVGIPLSVSANSSSLPQAMIPSSISEVLNATATATGGAVGGRRSLLQGTVFTFATGTPANPRKCVDVPFRSTTPGTQLQQWDCNGTPAQAFTLYDTGSYWYTIRNTNSGLCWTANNGGSTSGTAVVQASCSNSNNQKFDFFKVSSGWNLKPYHSLNQNMCLDINWNSPDNGAKVQLWSCNQTPAQYFTTSTGGGGTTSSPPPPINPGGCPSGWLPAVGTLYDSWPKPGTKECTDYSGCRWAGQFSQLGPQQSNPCKAPSQRLSGGSGTPTECRYPESVVAQWSIAATYDQDPSLFRKRLEVMVEGQPGRSVTVNVADQCNDADCNGCCRTNTGNKRWKLLDLEKAPASSLLGFSTSSPSFDINNVRYPTSTGRRPGAPEGSVMPLCYRVVGESQVNCGAACA